MTAPIAPHGISQPSASHSASISIESNIIIVKPVRPPPPERDEHVVDDQLAREPHEVHAPPAGEPAASDVRDADGQPQGDRQMQSGQHLGIAARREGENVGENGPGREEQRQPQTAHDVQAALPGEIGRELGQHKQAGVAGIERLVTTTDLKTEQRRHLDGQRRGDGEAQDDERFGARGLPRLIGGVGGDDQLFPQPLGVFACELARQRVEATHALDRDEEGFVPCQTGFGEHPHLVAQVALELLHVWAVDGPPTAQVRPPLRDLFLERRVVGGGRHAVHAFIQIPLRVSSTSCHCCRWAASWARPSLVMR